MQSATMGAATGGAPQPFWPSENLSENLSENSGNKARKSVRITPGLVIGEVLLTVGAVLLLFAFYESFWTNICLLYTSPSPRDS